MANEKRLIDANALRDFVSEEFKDDVPYEWTWALTVVDHAPAVDDVPVVRCEKCKHAVWDEEYKMWKCVESAEYDEESGVWFGFCEYHNGYFFCADGERKDGDGNG